MAVPLPPEQAPLPPKVSAIVVSHNRASLLRRSLAALEASEGRAKLQIIAIDNGSTDGSPEAGADFPDIQFIRLPKNFGLAKARNIGIRAAAGEYILFVDDDAEVAPDAVERLAACLDAEPDATAACPALLKSTGEPAPQFAGLPSPATPFPPWGTGPGECVLGAVLMVRSFFFQATRQIDERYGNHGCDAEICYQIRRAGRRVAQVSGARAVHHGGREWNALALADRTLGAAAFLSKHYGLGAGLKFRLRSLFRSLASPGEFWYLIQGQKCDGAQ